MTRADDLLAEATAIRVLGAEVIDALDIGSNAIEYGVRHIRVHPLAGKRPLLDDWQHRATDDVATIARWWGGQYRGANIGGLVPEAMIVLDIDNLDALTELEKKHGALPETLTVISGRAAGGKHLYYRRPSGKLTAARLPKGVELRWAPRQCVLPPSIHPDTRQRYRWADPDMPVAAPPPWLVELILPERIPPQSPRRHLYPLHTGPSIADSFSNSTSWATILQPHGWRCLDPDPDADGARWLHPTHTSSCSATIKHDCLFVYSTSTVFDATEPGNPKGYTKFRAHALLNHAGDLSAAARALRDRTVIS